MANPDSTLNGAHSNPAVNRFPYKPRVQFSGPFIWLCPQCGEIRRIQRRVSNWWIRCKNPYCKRTFVIGIRFLALKPNGPKPHTSPRDIYFPFPECEMGEYASGDDVMVVSEEE